MDSPVSVRPRQADPPPVRPHLWDKLPRALRDDSRLTDGDVRLAAVLIGYARNGPSCWPGNARLAADLRVTPRTIRNRLRRLEAAGWIACRPDRGNRTGRLIVLAWRSDDAEGRKPVSPSPRKPVSPERDRVVKGEPIQEIGRTIRPEAPEPPPPIEISKSSTVGIATPGPTREAEGPRIAVTAPERPEPAREAEGPPAPAWNRPRPAGRLPLRSLTVEDLARLAPTDPILARELARRTAPRPEPKPAPVTTPELIERLRECPTYPPMLAQLLTLDLADPGSFSGFHAVAQRAYRGEIELADLADAYRQATGPTARNRGAILMHAIKRIEGRDNKNPRPEAVVLGWPPRGGRFRAVAPSGGGDAGGRPRRGLSGYSKSNSP